MHTRLLALVFFGLANALHAAEAVSAKELAARLDTLRPMGSTLVRMRMETAKATLQIAVKERRSASSDEVAWQVLWPKERAGEAVILRQSGGRTTANQPLDAPLFGSALAVADAIENFYAWKNQSLAGMETVDGVRCAILESKPGDGDSSIYSRVRSWVDTRRLVPLRVEKYGRDGQLARRIETTRVVADAGRQIPANLTIHDVRRNTVTEVDGSRIQHDAKFTDADFHAP